MYNKYFMYDVWYDSDDLMLNRSQTFATCQLVVGPKITRWILQSQQAYFLNKENHAQRNSWKVQADRIGRYPNSDLSLTWIPMHSFELKRKYLDETGLNRAMPSTGRFTRNFDQDAINRQRSRGPKEPRAPKLVSQIMLRLSLIL